MPIIKEKATIIKAKELSTWHYSLPSTWLAAIGLLKKKNIDSLRYQKQIRSGWVKRLRKIGNKVAS